MKILKNNKGITLIALVVTIIVLLILAGITLVTLTGDNGLIEKANEAKISTELAGEREDLEVQIYSSHDKRGNLNIEKLKEKLGDRAGEETEFPLTYTYKDGSKGIIFDDGKYIDYFDIETGLGDVNFDGTVDEQDINSMIRFYLGSIDFTEKQKSVIDANKDGIFTGTDIIGIYELSFKKYGNDNFITAMGDVNLDGKIDYQDVKYIKNYLVHIPQNELDENWEKRADVDENDFISAEDTASIERILVNHNKYNINSDITMGDVNFDGKIDYLDIDTMIKILIKEQQIENNQKSRVDYNNDGVFDCTDLISIYEDAYSKYGNTGFVKAKGDVNLDGKIDNNDVYYIRYYLAHNPEYPLDVNGQKRADIDDEYGVDMKDVYYIAQIIANHYSINLE